MTTLSCFLVFSAVVVASSTKAVVTKTDQHIPGNVTIYAIDLEAGTSKAIASIAKDCSAVSGAAVCGGVYYAVFTDFAHMSYGLLSVDLSSASPEVKVLPTDSLFHKIACDPQAPHELLAIGSDSAVIVDPKKRLSQPRNGASFHLKRYKPLLSPPETYVATFPAKDVTWGGQDGIFAFKADASEVWASWPADACPDCAGHKSGGHLHVMDTTNGNIKKSLKIAGGSLFSKANPYFLVPDAMRGVFDPGHAEDIFWADLTFSGEALTWKKAQLASELWSSSQPKQTCQGNLLAPHVTGLGASTIFLVDPKDGSHIAAFDTSQIKAEGYPEFGAVACDEATYEQAPATHPKLPTMWTALVNETEVGIVHESEHFVTRSDKTNFSAKWTNFTDGSCQRLILEQGAYDVTRYLLGCDAVDCCTEDNTNGPIEYQIPNVHPAILAPVKFIGKETITLFDKSTVDADHWRWKFAILEYDAWTTNADDGTGILHKWSASTGGQQFPNEYVNYKAVPASEESAFMATFQVPEVCKGSQVMSCDGAHKQGKLSDKSVAFLRSGTKRDDLLLV